MVVDMDVGRSPIQLSTSAGLIFSRLTIRVHVSMKLMAWASDSWQLNDASMNPSEKRRYFPLPVTNFRGLFAILISSVSGTLINCTRIGTSSPAIRDGLSEFILYYRYCFTRKVGCSGCSHCQGAVKSFRCVPNRGHQYLRHQYCKRAP